MPIYEYLCNSCDSKKEHLQKINDLPVPACPTCGSDDYHKLISAARFQLQGSGWYETDFKNSKTAQPEAKQKTASEKKTSSTETSTSTKSDTSSSTAATSD